MENALLMMLAETVAVVALFWIGLRVWPRQP